MAENSKIEWTDHTFNPWTGCTAVSPACDHCYAEGWAKRSGHVQWGPHGERRRTSEANWRLPLKWDRDAAKAGKRAKVFCASLADVFDNHRSILPEWRADLWELISKTPNLDWLLLTKRPQNIAKMLPVMDSTQPGYRPWNDRWPWPNVWLGTTVENQAEADRRIPHLLAAPAKVRFLSCEPLLGPVDLLQCPSHGSAGGHWDWLTGVRSWPSGQEPGAKVDWVICGGESGPGARPMHPDWARSLRDQCQAAVVAFHFKQWGEWAPPEVMTVDGPAQLALPGKAASDPSLLHIFPDGLNMGRIGKKAAGRLLDGREWNEVPHG